MHSTNRITRPGVSRPTALIAAGGLLAGSAVLGLMPTAANASSHREAPLIAADPAVDNTDVYAFSSPENPDNVTFVANWQPFEEPNGGPNFYPWSDDAEYLINIDNDGDAKANIVYRWRFTTEDLRGTDTFLYNNGPVTSLDDENLLFRQTFVLDVSYDGGATYGSPLSQGPVAPSYTGPASMGSAQDYVDNLRTPAITGIGKDGAEGKTIATQAEDSFFLDLRVFDLLYGGDLSETGQDTLAGYNVNTIALEVPKADVAVDDDPTANPVIGIWSTTTRPTLRNADGTAAEGSGYTQVSRLGQPLVNEVVVPTGLKDAFNSIDPSVDATIPAVVDRVLQPEVPALIEGIYGVPAPAGPRYDLLEVFLTGVVSTEVLDVDGDPATKNPIDVDLNSQALNAGADMTTFMPSEMLRLNMSITGPTGLDGTPLHEASRLGVVGGDIQGFPNGRRLGDDVLDIELLALEGIYDVSNVPADRQGAFDALKGGDGVDTNDADFGDTFPYVAAPATEAVNQVNVDNAGDPSEAASDSGSSTVAAGGPGSDGTSAGSWLVSRETLVPAVTGSAAVLLVGAGVMSLVRRRSTDDGSVV
ncbi:DUF4331 domain-containing protein [Modestobacter sp. I12A-02628]|uniref:DUF4331 domain-containing protein n=1 Tax=Goekera deserti TaxID=2497753 RepID=A0A7K3WHQ5_9ACTN|nr:DUF4331 domain-containing protein [Goekera deserti]MPQ97772.1 DUF4331 domain-containing protein [Goekera deserti]NDI48417.1 DUF4331 domain-containing protein [Goekera deserti]NEL56018.1 DUF4331 domain-containing protein [Goekera deserti]